MEGTQEKQLLLAVQKGEGCAYIKKATRIGKFQKIALFDAEPLSAKKRS